MNAEPSQAHTERSVDYRLLRTALDQFGRPPESLAPEERHEVERIADRYRVLEAMVLTSDLAKLAERDIQPLSALERTLRESPGDLATLVAHGLELTDLAVAVRREQLMQRTLVLATSDVEPPTSDEVEAYYRQHPAQFRRGEERLVAHILGTVQADQADASSPTVLARLQQLRAELEQTPSHFGSLALRHSECPSALSNGVLGWMERGKLYPEVDRAAFVLPRGGISSPVESPLGWHLVQCLDIRPPREVSLESVRSRLTRALHDHQRELRQRDWLASLIRKEET